MSDKKDPKDLDLGTGLVDRAKRAILGRRAQIDSVTNPDAVKPEAKSPDGPIKKKVGKNAAKLIADLDKRIVAARAANNMDLVRKYTLKKKALQENK